MELKLYAKKILEETVNYYEDDDSVELSWGHS